MAQFSHPYMPTGKKTIALTIQTIVAQVMSLLFNMLSKLVMAFLPRSKCLLILWLKLPSAVIWEPKKIKTVTVSIVSPFICHEVMDLGENNGTPLQYSCLENPMDGGAWWATVHGVAKSRTRLNDFTFTFHFHALEKEMATHSSVLAWRIPGTGEPAGLPSMGSHRVGHD